jgi:colicin import membrane protein
MSVLAIIVLVVVIAAILIALFVFLPRLRERGRVKMRERELGQRRERVVSEQREEADSRSRQAEAAEQRARIAAQEAERERAEAQLRQERAKRHERGMADHELIEDHEREHFAGTSAVGEERSAGGAGAQAERDRTSAYDEGRRSVQDPSRVEDFREGRKQEEQDDDSPGLIGRLRGEKSD